MPGNREISATGRVRGMPGTVTNTSLALLDSR
jgi:hypothetical protein